MKSCRTNGKPIAIVVIAMALLLLGSAARAVDQLTIVDTVLDRPTLIALGVQLLISGDDNHNASVAVRYRKAGDPGWRDGLPLFRVHPENVSGMTVPEQFAGSIFNLRPGTTYEIELTAHDPDGPADQIRTLTATTRSIPADPPSPQVVNVSDVSSLNSALNNAAAGDVILLADGTYNGTFSMTADGASQNPIVIRGQGEEGVILDGGGDGGNVLEIYGGFVHVENLTLATTGARRQTTTEAHRRGPMEAATPPAGCREVAAARAQTGAAGSSCSHFSSS